ncbi:hypothetical protein HanHA300_Chr12g0433911 [Helianthus annuus]|nr:hypothetical protein HanHA300_Chr12g0433911 [Helianthus annuus]KAJ0504372.1 hypothetical protein HanHA89_Chr12g0458561 [Helianthus annuus]KAJ0674081.1 hypothetical protein HanLR1_Chr12g0436041 [Helianthus annuus]
MTEQVTNRLQQLHLSADCCRLVRRSASADCFRVPTLCFSCTNQLLIKMKCWEIWMVFPLKKLLISLCNRVQVVQTLISEAG